MTQNTLKQTPLKHIFGKERGNGKMWAPSMLVAVQPQLWAEGPSLSLAAPSAQPNDGCRQASLWKEFHIFHKLYGNQEIQLGTSRLRGGLGPRVEKNGKAQGHGACKGEPNQDGQRFPDSRQTRPQRLLQLQFIEHYKILCIYFHIITISLQIIY